MKRLLFFLALLVSPAFAQTGAVQGHCFLGGTKALLSGIPSTNYLDGVIPSCTVTVYLTGTSTKATIFSDGISTPLANPFTANTASSVDPGGWIFRAATNAGLDVVLSGGVTPNTYPFPRTLTDIFPSQSFTPVAGLTSINSQTGPAINVHSSDSSITVTTTTNDIDLTTAAAGGAVNVNGSPVSNANFNGTTPAAPAGATNKTFQVSGSDVSAYDYAVQYSPTTTQSFFVTDSRGVTSTDSFNGVGNWTATSFSCDGTTCTATVASDSFTGTSDWALIDYTTHSPTCLTAAIVPVTVVNSTHFTFPESYTYCSGVTSGTGGTGNYATNMLQPLTSKQPFFKNHGTTKQLLIQSTGGGSVALYNTNFSTAITPSVSACVSGGGPCYVFVSLGFDDLYATPCATVATLEGTVGTAGSYRKLFNDLHQLGGAVKVVAVTESTRLTAGVTCSSNSQFTMSAVNQFQASLVGVGAATSGSLDYADYVIDAATALGNMDGGNFIDGIHYSNSGNAVFAQAMNNGLAAQGSLNLGASANNGPNLLHGEQMTTLGASTGNGIVQSFGHSGSLTRDFYLQNDVGQPEFYGNSGNLAMVWRWNSGTSAMWDTIPNNAGFCFYNGTTSAASVDTCVWRDSAGVITIGNTTKQDASGGLKLANLTVSGTCTGCGASGLSGMTSGQVGVAGSSSTITSSKPLAGSAAGVTTGPTSGTTAAHLATFVGTDGSIQDGGALAGTSPIVVTGTTISCPTCGTSSGGTNVSQNSGATETNLPITGYMPQVCSDTSASGTAQACTVPNTFTPQAGNCVVYKTTTANSGTGLTVNINSLGAKSVAVAGSAGWTTTLTASLSIPANKPMNLCYDGTNWDASGTGYLPSAAATATPTISQYAFAAETGSVASVTTNSITTVAGHTLFAVCAAGASASVTTIPVTDSQSNTWTHIKFQGASGSFPSVDVWWLASVVNAGATTFTCTPNITVSAQSAIVLDYASFTSPSVFSSSGATGTTFSFPSISTVSTSGRTLAIWCARATLATSFPRPHTIAGTWSAMQGVSGATLSNTASDMGCEAAFIPVTQSSEQAFMYFTAQGTPNTTVSETFTGVTWSISY